jgi:hypothetical protein
MQKARRGPWRGPSHALHCAMRRAPCLRTMSLRLTAVPAKATTMRKPRKRGSSVQARLGATLAAVRISQLPAYGCRTHPRSSSCSAAPALAAPSASDVRAPARRPARPPAAPHATRHRILQRPLPPSLMTPLQWEPATSADAAAAAAVSASHPWPRRTPTYVLQPGMRLPLQRCYLWPALPPWPWLLHLHLLPRLSSKPALASPPTAASYRSRRTPADRPSISAFSGRHAVAGQQRILPPRGAGLCTSRPLCSPCRRSPLPPPPALWT